MPAQRQLVRERHLLELVASDATMSTVLAALVGAIEREADGIVGSVLLLEDGRRLRHGAAPNVPAAYVAAIDGVEIGPAVGSCGTAAYLKETVVVEDIATDPRWAGYREVALGAGLRACTSVPIFGSDGAVLGTFALYYATPWVPTPALMELTQHAAQLAAIAITRHHRQIAFVASERRAGLIVESALDANVLMDSAGRVTGWSRRAVELFGWTVAEALGRSVAELLVPEHQRAAHARGLERYLATGQSAMLGRRIELRARHRDGHELPVELAVTPLELDGQTCFSAFISDIRARKDAEERARAQQQHLATIYAHVDDALFELAVEGAHYRFVSINPAFTRVTGLAPATVLGHTIAELVPAPALARVHDRFAEALRTRATVRWDETRQLPSGRREGDVAVTPVFDDDGRPTALIGSIRDMTERRRLDAEVRHLQKMELLGRLSAGVAHDFNNILAVVLMTSQMMEHGPAGAALHDELHEITEACERGRRLTRQFLAFSRARTEPLAAVDLRNLVANLEQMLRRLLGEHIVLATRIADDVAPVQADPGQLEQLLVNLALNGRDAMPDGGTLTLEVGNVTRPDGPRVMLAVHDDGHGMDAETRAQILEPFFTTKPPGRGTGLGLALVDRVVQQSGGTLEIESAPGRGATFRVYLPRTALTPAAPAVTRAAVPLPPRRWRALVVDDDPAVRSTLARVIQQLGGVVDVAADGEEALAAIDEAGAAPDVLIADTVMPGMPARALGDHLRRTHPATRVLYMSGYPDDVIAGQGVLDPATPFLRKPFTTEALATALRGLLEPRPGAATG